MGKLETWKAEITVSSRLIQVHGLASCCGYVVYYCCENVLCKFGICLFEVAILLMSCALFSFYWTMYRWISVGSDLKFDARRDLDDVGATSVEGSILTLLVHEVLNLLLRNIETL